MRFKKYFIRPLSIVLAMVLLVQSAPLHGFVPVRAFVFPVTTLDELPGTPEMPTQVSRHVSEVMELRTADSRHFRNEDGTYTAYVYPDIIHFEDSYGNWIEIDNTLVRQGDFYIPRASGMDVQFPAVLGEQGIRMHTGRHGFSLGVPGANSEAIVPDLNVVQEIMLAYLMQGIGLEDINVADIDLEALVDFPAKLLNREMAAVRNLQSVVYYLDVWPGAHLEYILSPEGIKENIIVMQPKAQYVYEFSLNLYNLIAVQRNERVIVLYCEVMGRAQMVIEAPYARDAAGVQNFEALTISLDENTLTLTACSDWMNAPEREFPVVLDPTYISVADTSRIMWLDVHERGGQRSGLFDFNMEVGTSSLQFMDHTLFPQTSRGYLQFPMPRMPQDAVPINATLILDDDASPWWLNLVNWLVMLAGPIIRVLLAGVDVATGGISLILLNQLWSFIASLPARIFNAVLGAAGGPPSRDYEVNLRAEMVLEQWSPARNDVTGALVEATGGPARMTWDNQPATTGIALALGEPLEPDDSSGWMRALQGFGQGQIPFSGQYSFDITDAVRHWAEVGEQYNFGIMLRADDESLNSENMLNFAMGSIATSIPIDLSSVVGFFANVAYWVVGQMLPSEGTPGTLLNAAYMVFGMLSDTIGAGFSIPILVNNLTSDPIVAITYISTTGLQPFFSYETVNMGRAGTAHVNHFTGGLTVTHPTVQLDGERMPVGLSHVYMSNHDSAPGQVWNMNLGVGFRLNVMEMIKPANYYEQFNFMALVFEFIDRMGQWIFPDAFENENAVWEWIRDNVGDYFNNPTQYYMFMDGTGGMHRFVQDTEDEGRFTFVKQTNPTITMRRAGGGPLFPERIISDEFGNERIYRQGYRNPFGRYNYFLSTIRDANGNETNLFYENGQLVRIVDTIGRTIHLNWNSDGYLTSITCPIGRVTSFTYDHETFGFEDERVSVLTHITYHDGLQTQFHYAQMVDTNREVHNRTRLTAASNHDDHHFVFEFEPTFSAQRTNYRVTSITHGVGGSVDEERREHTPGGRRWWQADRYGTWFQQALFWMSNMLNQILNTVLGWAGMPGWLRIDDYGRWYVATNLPEDPTYGDEEIIQVFTFDEVISVTDIHYGRNYMHVDGRDFPQGNITTVINSLGEPEGVTYIFDRMGRAVGARDNAEDNHAFVLFTESDGVQNLPGFMAGAAIVENLFNPTGWLGATHAFAGNNSRIAWQAAPSRSLRQTVHNVERGTYTVSFYAMSEGGSARLYANSERHYLDVTDRWERHSVTFEHTSNNISVEIQALSGNILVEGLQLEQNAGASPFNHVANSHFARGGADWHIANAGLEDGLDFTEPDEQRNLLQRAWDALTGSTNNNTNEQSVWLHGHPDEEKVLWQPIYLGANATGRMLLFGATAQMAATRSEPFYTRVAVRFFDAAGQLIELETDFDCDDDDCDDCYENDCDIVGNVRENQAFATFSRDVRGVPQTAAMAHTVPDDAVRANLYIVYNGQATGRTNAMRVDNAFVYIGAAGSTMSYLGGRVSEVRSSSGTATYTWDGPNVQSVTFRRPDRPDEEEDRIDFEYDDRHNVARIVERRHTDEGENLITETLFDYKTGFTNSFSRTANSLTQQNIGGIVQRSTVLTFVGNLTDEENNIWTANGVPLASYQTVTYVNDYNDVRRVADSNGSWIEYFYYSRNRNIVTRVETSDGSIFAYDYNNFVQSEPHAFDVLNRIRAFAGYDESNPAHWLHNQYDFTGMGVQSETITGLLRSIQRTNGTHYTFQYNHLGQVEQVRIGGQLMVENTYVGEDEVDHAAGLRRFALTSRTYANGFRFAPIYDRRGRVVGEQWGTRDLFGNYNMSTQYEYIFADNGMLAQVQNHNLRRTTDFMYDTQGRLTSIHARATVNNAAIQDSRVRLGFNDDGALDILRVSLNGREISRVEYFYDSFERPYRSVLMGTEQLHSFSNETGRLTGSMLGPLSTTFDFDDTPGTAAGRNVLLAGNLTEISHYIGQEQLMTFSYTYREGSGNIESITVDCPVQGERTNTFTYDQIGQLVRDVSPGRDSEYRYDIGGNMTAWYVNGVRQRSFYYGNPNWPDQLTGVRDAGGDLMPITYDDLGNMTNFNGRNFTWQRGRQLASITGQDLMATFTYDHTGLRSSKTVNGVTSYYVWAGGLLMARYTPAREELIAWHYSQDGQMLGFELNGVPYFYVRNLQGDVVAILDAAGNTVATYIYDAWGNHLYIMDSEIARINPIRYRGYYWDDEIQMYYLQSRYYCPALRRFISADVYMDTGVGILGTNMYAYCNNDPVNHWDPDGFNPRPIPAWALLETFQMQFDVANLAKDLGIFSDSFWDTLQVGIISHGPDNAQYVYAMFSFMHGGQLHTITALSGDVFGIQHHALSSHNALNERRMRDALVSSAVDGALTAIGFIPVAGDIIGAAAAAGGIANEISGAIRQSQLGFVTEQIVAAVENGAAPGDRIFMGLSATRTTVQTRTYTMATFWGSFRQRQVHTPTTRTIWTPF
ncbi:MAG: hypothetical protein FWE40_01085 [Oscillospiraceae bacterium]|nr:hypothetical protein [Oscillospiraceae bacterium]